MAAGSPNVEILFQQAMTSPGIWEAGSGIVGVKGKKGKTGADFSRNQRILVLLLWCRSVQGIPAFPPIQGWVGWEEFWEGFQRSPLQGCLMTN